MKKVLLGADCRHGVYSVPDVVADNLEKYCLGFCDWIWNDPNGAKLIKLIDGHEIAFFDETHFIDYLNEWLFPKQKSELILEIRSDDEITDEYDALPWFNF